MSLLFEHQGASLATKYLLAFILPLTYSQNLHLMYLPQTRQTFYVFLKSHLKIFYIMTTFLWWNGAIPLNNICMLISSIESCISSSVSMHLLNTCDVLRQNITAVLTIIILLSLPMSNPHQVAIANIVWLCQRDYYFHLAFFSHS